MPYLYLVIAIAGELIGTTCLKYADGFSKLYPTLGVIISYGICFLFFSKALRSINLSVAYATWSGIGIIAATLLSVFLFKQEINFMGIIGVILVVAGVVILNFFGTSH